MKKTLVPALIGLLLYAGSASAVPFTLTFPGSFGLLAGSVSEGVFTYDTFSGRLHREGSGGNPAPHLSGYPSFVTPGGVLRIVRNDVAGGLFTFDAADVAVWNFGGNNVTVEGFLSGLSQGTDTLITLTGDGNWATRSSVNLNGVLLDQLRITLDAFLDLSVFPTSGWEELDNVVLSPQTASVPDPGATLLLLLTSCAALGGLRLRIAR